MPQVIDVFSRKNALADLAEAISYRLLKSDDALYVHTRDGWKVDSRDKATALSHQGFTLCLDNLSQFLKITETSDDGVSEANKIKEWMEAQS